jgi:hypothetical protein
MKVRELAKKNRGRVLELTFKQQIFMIFILGYFYQNILLNIEKF